MPGGSSRGIHLIRRARPWLFPLAPPSSPRRVQDPLAPRLRWASLPHYVIDTGFGSETAELLRSNLDRGKQTIVVNTHHHWEHIWGNWGFRDCDIVAQEGLPKLAREKWDLTLETNRKYVRGEVALVLPTILVAGSISFEDDGIPLFSSKGHSDDSLSVFCRDGGFLIAGENIGDSDEAMVPSLASCVEDYRKTLDTYAGLAPRTILSGHNRAVDRRYLDKIKAALAKAEHSSPDAGGLDRKERLF